MHGGRRYRRREHSSGQASFIRRSIQKSIPRADSMRADCAQTLQRQTVVHSNWRFVTLKLGYFLRKVEKLNVNISS